MIAKVHRFQNLFWGLLVPSKLLTRPLQLRSMLFLPGTLVFPVHAPGLDDRY